MCSVVILYRPGHDWPVLLAANRDEMAGRPWAPPARHWPDRPNVVAGLDRLAGGSWLGLNDEGVLAGVLNRVDSLGPLPGKRSRGELVLEALDHADAREASDALSHLDPAAYRSFNMVLADNRDAYWLRSLGIAEGRVEAMRLPTGLSMITAHDRNDRRGSRRIATYLPQFRRAGAPDPEAGNWSNWERLAASRIYDAGGTPHDAMTIVTESGFETVSGSLVALPAVGRAALRPRWRFAAGRPGEAPFQPVEL